MDTLFSGQYFLRKLVYLALFSLRLGGSINNFEVTLAARGEGYKSGLSNVFKMLFISDIKKFVILVPF